MNKSKSSIEHFGKFLFQLQQLEKKPLVFGNAGKLTPSEIHMIDAIGADGGLFMSALAKRLGVTKGAATQMAARLEQKQLIVRQTSPADSRSVLVTLTAVGRDAFFAHKRLHEQFYMELREQLDDQEIAIFESCIFKLTQYLREKSKE